MKRRKPSKIPGCSKGLAVIERNLRTRACKIEKFGPESRSARITNSLRGRLQRQVTRLSVPEVQISLYLNRMRAAYIDLKSLSKLV